MNETNQEHAESFRTKQVLRNIVNQLITQFTQLSFIRAQLFYAIDRMKDEDVMRVKDNIRKMLADLNGDTIQEEG